MDLSLIYKDYWEKLHKDPVYWIKTNLKLDIELYDYQVSALRDKSSKKALSWSRQSGKSTAICLEALHTALKSNGQRVVVITSGGVQRLLFQMVLQLLEKSSVSIRSVLNNRRIDFDNNSRIEFYRFTPSCEEDFKVLEDTNFSFCNTTWRDQYVEQ